MKLSEKFKKIRSEKNPNILPRIISTIVCSFCLLFCLVAFLPIIRGWRHVYPIPEGQVSPSIEYFYTSMAMCTLEVGNPIVIITFIMCLINIVLIILSFTLKDKKAVVIIRIIAYILFVINLFLIIGSIMYSLSFIRGNAIDY